MSTYERVRTTNSVWYLFLPWMEKYLDKLPTRDYVQKLIRDYCEETLEKKAYVEDPPPVNLYGKYWLFWPINYFVFSIDSIDLHSLKEIMMKRYAEERLLPYCRIDTTCVLGV